MALACQAGTTRPIDVLHYDASLAIDLEARKLTGRVTITLRPTASSAAPLQLDAGSLHILSVQELRQDVPFQQQDGVLSMNLARPLKNGKERTVTIQYEGTESKGLRFYPDQAYTAFFTNNWLPSNDDPGDAATLTLRIQAAGNLRTAGSGRFAGESSNGEQRTTVWEQSSPVPPFVYGFAVGKFDELTLRAGKTNLRFLTFGRPPERVNRVFEATQAAMAFLEDKAGVPYPWDEYGQVLVRGKAEQEVAHFTLLKNEYGDSLLANPQDTWLLVHELAHQWWGIAVHCEDWSHFWLNEGLATFLAAAFAEKQYGHDAYLAHIERSRQQYQEARAARQDLPLAAPGLKTRNISYHKGAWVLHLLRERIGDDAFWEGLRLYTRSHMNQFATSKDMQVAMERASRKNLAAFFDEWVFKK